MTELSGKNFKVIMYNGNTISFRSNMLGNTSFKIYWKDPPVGHFGSTCYWCKKKWWKNIEEAIEAAKIIIDTGEIINFIETKYG